MVNATVTQYRRQMALPEFIINRIAAEIREQMDGVQALVSQLARLRLSPDAEACVAGVSDAATAVSRTLAQGLDLKAVATQSLTLQTGPVRLRELMDAIQAGWQARARQAGVTLLVSYDGDPEACVITDGLRLRQVFDGLIGEAVAGARGGSVELGLRAVPVNGSVRLEGRVRGGRDAAWHGQDLETRIRDIDARLGLEVAMGVVLARHTLQSLAGVLRDDAAINGVATVAFDLTVPAAERPSAAPPPADAPRLHILVVDDNATNRVVAQALCEMLNCTSEAAEDGVEAVEAAQSGRFDMILMDIRMPRMDGVEATRQIRRMGGKAGATPIVALTANVDPEDAASYRAAGMCGVLEKPIKADDLRNAMRDALGLTGEAAAA